MTDSEGEELFQLAYDELRAMARSYLRGERNERTLQTTALVHEAFLKLNGSRGLEDRGRSYFFAAAARAMRQVLVEAARARRRAKRGSGERPRSLSDLDPGDLRCSDEVLWINDALGRFSQLYPRQAKVIECRFFAGYSVEETAEALDISERTVKRDWAFAQAWMFREWGQHE